MIKRLIAPVLFCCMILFSCTADKLELEPPPEPIDTTVVPVDTSDTVICNTCKFAEHIQPIIDLNCAFTGCHASGFGSGDFTAHSGILDKIDNNGPFDTRALINQDMPPSGPLSQADRDLIQCWLDNGALDN